MSMAIMAATRSKDSQSQYGCVLVKNKRIIGTGYNSFPRFMPDDILPNIRPKKYPWMIHAEANAIYNSIEDICGCVCYVNGMPCLECLKALYQNRVTEIVILSGKAAMINAYSEHEKDVYNSIIKYGNIQIRQIKLDNTSFTKALKILDKSQ